VGCGVDVGVGIACSNEHDRRRNAEAIITRRILMFTKNVLIYLLLADGILQNSQSLDFNSNFVPVL
jgi:hypothetical protein